MHYHHSNRSWWSKLCKESQNPSFSIVTPCALQLLCSDTGSTLHGCSHLEVSMEEIFFLKRKKSFYQLNIWQIMWLKCSFLQDDVCQGAPPDKWHYVTTTRNLVLNPSFASRRVLPPFMPVLTTKSLGLVTALKSLSSPLCRESWVFTTAVVWSQCLGGRPAESPRNPTFESHERRCLK